MRSILSISICIIVFLSGLGIVGISGVNLEKNTDMALSPDSFPDLSAYRYTVAQFSFSEQTNLNPLLRTLIIEASDGEYPLGAIIWQYQITGEYDTGPNAIAGIDDINDDGIDDVIICSDDNFIRCFSGGVIDTGVVLWEHEIYSGNIYQQHGLTVTGDINGDGYNDCVVGATGGARLIRCLSGQNGQTIWTHDTHEYGDGGWVYQVDCRYDYNSDGVLDVIAATGDDSSETGPKRIYCLDGLTGLSIWELPLGGPGFAAVGVEDFTGDGFPDVVAGCSNDAESIGFAKGINGVTGVQMWSFQTPGSSVWAVEQIDDATGDGKKDTIIGDFSGHIYGLNAATGSEIYSSMLGSGVIITRFERLDDVNGDGHTDIIPAHSTTSVTQVIDGYTGALIWSHSVADQPWNVASIADINRDGIDDVLVGTLYNSNYVYFLNGVNGSELKKISYGQAVDAIAGIPDVIGDGSMEMVAGGRNGKVVCFSGGELVNITAEFTAAPRSGAIPFVVQFMDLSTAENTTITSWEWDFDDDGTIDSNDQNPSWTYTEVGTYTVSLTVSDGEVSDTEIKVDYINSTIVVIGNITGGLLGVSTEIHNKGTLNVTSVNWSIVLDGGFILFGKTKSETIALLPANDSVVITDKPVVGFGRIIITITIEVPYSEPIAKTATGFLLLFVVVGIK